MNPVYIVGCPRSGNTLLGCLLNKHSRLVIFFEFNTFHFQHRRWMHRVSVEDENPVDTFVDVVGTGLSSWEEKMSSLDVTRDDLRKSATMGEGEWGAMLDHYLSHLARKVKPSAGRWGDKTPQNLANLDLIQATYPSAQFLHIYRDPRDTVRSLSDRSFPPASNNRFINAEVYRQYYRMYENKKCKIDPGRLYDLRYEDLLESPREALSNVCNFLGVDFEDRMLGEADPDIKRAVGWANYKGWGAIEPQPSSQSSKEDGVSLYLADILEARNYRREQPGFSDWLDFILCVMVAVPFRGVRFVLDWAWRRKYPDHGAFILQKFPSSRLWLRWIGVK